MCVTSPKWRRSHVVVEKTPAKPSIPPRRLRRHSPSIPPHPLDPSGSVSTGIRLAHRGLRAATSRAGTLTGRIFAYHSQTAFRRPSPAESRVNSHHQLSCGGVQIAGGLLHLDSQPKEKCHLLRERVAWDVLFSLPLAQGYSQGPAITVPYCGQLPSSKFQVCVCARALRPICLVLQRLFVLLGCYLATLLRLRWWV